MLEEINDKNFDQVVMSHNLVIVDFWAPWCSPCVMLTPILEEVARESADKVKIYKVNVDENSQLAAKYSIRSIPSLLMFKSGQLIDNMVGGAAKSKLLEWIDQHS